MALAAGSAFGTVALNFNAEFESGVPQNLSNSLGVPTNGMIWGVIIDGSGNGLVNTSEGSYDAISLATGSNYILSVGSVATDDVLWTSMNLTADTSGSTEGDGLTPGGPGGIFDISGIALANGVTTGDTFYVVWFDGTVGGILTDATFTIPSDGAALSYGEPFVGVDAIRSAGSSYVGTSGTPVAGGGIQFVPEPSAALLGAIGALGLLRRRRI